MTNPVPTASTNEDDIQKIINNSGIYKDQISLYQILLKTSIMSKREIFFYMCLNYGIKKILEICMQASLNAQ